MAACRDCGEFVVFLRKSDSDGYMRPVVPVSLDSEGERLFVADDQGIGRPPPQLFRMHVCLSPEEKARRQRERAEEKQRLIEADRERRRIARETEEALEAERAARQREKDEIKALKRAQVEEEDRQREERRLVKAFWRDAEYATGQTPKHLLTVACRECGQEPGVACLQLNSDGSPYRPELTTSAYRVERGWHITRPHNARYRDSPPNPVRPARTPRWGEGYKGPWPPARNDPGRYDMRAWLSENHTIFDTDERPSPDWMFRMSTSERVQMARFVRTGASILWGDQEEVPDGTRGVDQEDPTASAQGVLRDRREAGLGADVGQEATACGAARPDESGRPLEGDREHEDRA